MGHWIDGATTLPENARSHFRRFSTIKQAWEQSKDGVFLVWLAKHYATTEGERMDVQRAAEAATQRLGTSLQRYWSTKERLTDDPLPLSYGDVIVDIHIAAGTKQASERKVSRDKARSGNEYDAYRTEALLIAADAVRERLWAPEP